jgi:hypothetical protein
MHLIPHTAHSPQFKAKGFCLESRDEGCKDSRGTGRNGDIMVSRDDSKQQNTQRDVVESAHRDQASKKRRLMEITEHSLKML